MTDTRDRAVAAVAAASGFAHDPDCPARDKCECGAEGFREWAQRLADGERERLAKAVEALPILDYSTATYVDGGSRPVPYIAEQDYYVKRAAVLALLREEESHSEDVHHNPVGD